jgi:hypothetical protein
MNETIKWADGPNRHERRRRYAMMRILYGFRPTRGAFGASPINTENARKRKGVDGEKVF